jgi:hypothetical protein
MSKDFKGDIEIEANLNGKSKIYLKGQDISNQVRQAVIILNAGESPRVELAIVGKLKLKGKANIFPEETTDAT